MIRFLAFLLFSGFVALVSLLGIRASTLHSQDAEIGSAAGTVQGTQDFDLETGNEGFAARNFSFALGQTGQWPTTNPFSQQHQNITRWSNSVYGRQDSKTAKAYKVLQSAETDQEKREAEAELRKALEEEYVSSLEAYEEHLQALSDKLKRLEDELDKRRSAQDELVDLRLKTLINQAQGLGWPGQSNVPGNFESSFFYQVQPGQTVRRAKGSNVDLEPNRKKVDRRQNLR